jgi:hypothetical protein
MRTLEAGLDAIRTCLAIPRPNNPNCGTILTPILGKVTAMGRGWPETVFFEDVHGRLDIVRRAWRNGTMHVEIVYTEEDAQILFDATKALMQKIASRMDENGQPLA